MKYGKKRETGLTINELFLFNIKIFQVVFLKIRSKSQNVTITAFSPKCTGILEAATARKINSRIRIRKEENQDSYYLKII